MKKIQEAVTFIKASREEAITLANDIGDAEVHALVIQKGFTANPEPVGYMVVPLAKESLMHKEPLTEKEIIETCDTWIIDSIGIEEVIFIVRRTELHHGIGVEE
jgi:hypothetical protein